MKDPDARPLPRVTYLESLERSLRVMDTTAISLCMDNKLPIVVFNMRVAGNIARVVTGDKIRNGVRT